jgi:AraC family transcriptional regulator of adaptative response/methylated-DNA-[protein]-cysteine methyltransferase
MNEYQRVAGIIEYLDQHHAEQPDLAALARSAHLSPSHFHRLFSAWAGVTPKDFLQCLTFEHARRLLECGESVLDTALEVGLSGPGRLHDLCVNLDAASPGEIKAGGEGWEIVAGIAESPFGLCLIAESPRGICHLSFLEPSQEKTAWADLRQRWPKAALSQKADVAARYARRIFRVPSEPDEQRPLRALVKGTPFQLQVWRALIKVASGQLITYGRLARQIGHPTAARAVGSAVGRNPLAYIIPCHRVIRESGIIGEYHWGGVRKRVMVAWEGARVPLT